MVAPKKTKEVEIEEIETKEVEEVEIEEPEPQKSYQQQLNDIDKQITELQAKKKEMAKLAVKELESIKEVPLVQLNAIANFGAEKARKMLGDKWVN